MMGSVSDAQIRDAGPARRRRKGSTVLMALLVLLVAVALLVAAFYYVGGLSSIGSLLGPSSTPTKQSSAVAPVSTPAATSTPAPSGQEFAQRMYVEQLESHAVLERMAQGGLDSLVVKHVDAKESSATIALLATFTDGTYADGVMDLSKRDGAWYLFTLTGMRKSGTQDGLSNSVAGFTEAEKGRSVEEEAASIGVTTFDSGVIDTLVSEQGKHQDLVKAIFDGTYNALSFGAPRRGVNTVTIPMKLTGPGSKVGQGEVILITKTIDGKSRTFLTTLGQ
jgi:hypothetical protein